MQNILITGVSSGIGKYITEHLNSDLNIWAVSRKNPQIPWINFISCDLTKSSDLKKLLSKLKTAKISLDAVIFNAWVGYFDSFEKIKDKEYLNMMTLNLYSNIILTKKFFHFFYPNQN
jgi:short-subunit dehydrogenase